MNILVFSFQVTVALTLFVVFPLALGSVLPLWVPLLLTALTTTQLWAAIHEGIHGNLHQNPKWNAAMMHSMSLIFGSSAYFLRETHLAHHSYNRTDIELVEVYSGESPPRGFRFFYYFMLTFGLYFFELLIPWLYLLPERLQSRIFSRSQFLHKAHQKIIKRGLNNRIRINLIFLGVFFVCLFFIFRDSLFSLLAILFVRGFLISMLDYVYHYGTAAGDRTHGKNLRLPALVSRFILHFNYHGVHHLKPMAPWQSLPDEFYDKACRFESGFLEAVIQQLRGPLSIDALPKRG
jgi:fatty acid desaturase